jgi:hypothetical protein
MDISGFGKIILFAGLCLTLLGALILLAGKVPFLGRLPGDIHIQRPGFHFHFPIITCLLLSVFLTIILNIFLKR